MSISPGEILKEKYQVLQAIGQGGMGTVYLARSIEHPEFEVAIKVLDETFAKQPELRQRFRTEALVGYRVSHPHVLRVYEFFDETNVLAFAMELAMGGSMAELLHAGELDIKDSLRLIWESGHALRSLHQQGIAHCDIKPENILLTPEKQTKLSDFGLAVLPGDMHATNGSTLAGTPRYVPPEYIERRLFDTRGDIYSWGAIAYECLAGVPLFDGEEEQALLTKKMDIHGQDLLQRNEKVSPALAMWVMRCLSPVENRFQKIEHALDGLESCLGSYELKFETGVNKKSFLKDLLKSIELETPALAAGAI